VCEGCDQDWLPAAGRLYKFIQTDGVTFQEAQQMCEDNGGFLAELQSEEERQELLRLHGEQQPRQSYFLAALNLLTGAEAGVRRGWWVGLSDREREGSWVYPRTGASMTYTAGWYNNYPRNYAGDFGSADCAGLFSRQHFLDLDIDWGEQQYILDGLTADTDFKLADLSCHYRAVPILGVRMSPLCQKL